MRNHIESYRKKPVAIEAYQWDGSAKSAQEIGKWIAGCEDNTHTFFLETFAGEVTSVYIRTLEGDMTVDLGDFVIKGVEGEFYPCKPEIFKKTYEEFDGLMQEWVDIQDDDEEDDEDDDDLLTGPNPCPCCEDQY